MLLHNGKELPRPASVFGSMMGARITHVTMGFKDFRDMGRHPDLAGWVQSVMRTNFCWKPPSDRDLMAMQAVADPSIYYESHITIDPLKPENQEAAANIAENHGFRIAKFVMNDRDSFMTSRSPQRHVLEAFTHQCVQALQDSGIEVRRYKIESALVDSKIRDEWSLL